MSYFECFGVTVSTTYCFNAKLRLFVVRNWVLLYINENENGCAQLKQSSYYRFTFLSFLRVSHCVILYPLVSHASPSVPCVPLFPPVSLFPLWALCPLCPHVSLRVPLCPLFSGVPCVSCVACPLVSPVSS